MHEEHIFVADTGGSLWFGWGKHGRIEQLNIDCKDVIGIEVAPRGEALAVFGIEGYVVFVCEDGVWRQPGHSMIWNGACTARCSPTQIRFIYAVVAARFDM